MPKIKRAGLGYVRTVTTVKWGRNPNPVTSATASYTLAAPSPLGPTRAWDWLRDEE